MRDPARHRIGRRPRYYEPSSVVAVRLPEGLRRILEYLVATTGAETVSGYLRTVLEDHLAGLGFHLEEGHHRPADWSALTPEQVRAWEDATLRARQAVDSPAQAVDSLRSARG